MFGFVRLSKYNEVLDAKLSSELNLGVYQRVYRSQVSKLVDLRRELEVAKTKTNLTHEEIMFMIKCIHPDKHSNSSISNRVTGKLLDWKKRK